MPTTHHSVTRSPISLRHLADTEHLKSLWSLSILRTEWASQFCSILCTRTPARTCSTASTCLMGQTIYISTRAEREGMNFGIRDFSTTETTKYCGSYLAT